MATGVFSLFPKLPTEIQDEIWLQAVPKTPGANFAMVDKLDNKCHPDIILDPYSACYGLARSSLHTACRASRKVLLRQIDGMEQATLTQHQNTADDGLGALVDLHNDLFCPVSFHGPTPGTVCGPGAFTAAATAAVPADLWAELDGVRHIAMPVFLTSIDTPDRCYVCGKEFSDDPLRWNLSFSRLTHAHRLCFIKLFTAARQDMAEKYYLIVPGIPRPTKKPGTARIVFRGMPPSPSAFESWSDEDLARMWSSDDDSQDGEGDDSGPQENERQDGGSRDSDGGVDVPEFDFSLPGKSSCPHDATGKRH